jgi:hypothetical protein
MRLRERINDIIKEVENKVQSIEKRYEENDYDCTITLFKNNKKNHTYY